MRWEGEVNRCQPGVFTIAFDFEDRSRNGAVARVLTSHHCGLGWCYMWVEFVVGVDPRSKGFSRDRLVFLLLQKLTF